MPSYNLQSVVDVKSGLIVHHDVYNDANDSHMLHPVSVAAKKVLKGRPDTGPDGRRVSQC